MTSHSLFRLIQASAINITNQLYIYRVLLNKESYNIGVLASSAVDRGFEPRSGHIKDYEIGIYCFSAKQAALRRKSKDWFGRNQDDLSEWDDKSIHGPHDHFTETEFVLAMI